jgi:hypothetical protein
MPVTTTAPPLELTIDKAENLIRKLTDGLVNIKDETGEFLMPRTSHRKGAVFKLASRADSKLDCVDSGRWNYY